MAQVPFTEVGLTFDQGLFKLELENLAPATILPHGLPI
jgi:hypothetical protein